MRTLKKVLVKDALGEREEEHIFEICSECFREIDNSLEGFYGHSKKEGLILCQQCYEKLIREGSWETERVKVKGKWL